MDTSSGYSRFHANRMIAGLAARDETERVRSSHFDPNDRDGVFQLRLCTKVKLRSTGSGGKERKRIALLYSGRGAIQHGDEARQIYVGAKAAAVPLRGKAAEGEGVGNERRADFGKRERMDGDILAFGFAAEIVGVRLTAVIGRLSDEQEHTAA